MSGARLIRPSRIRHLVRKELIQVRRDPRLFRVLIAAPLFQLLVLGFAASTDVRDVAVAVRDDDATPASRDYVRSVGASGHLRPVPVAGPHGADEQQLVAGSAGLILWIPRGFGAAFARGEAAAVQALVDGADSNYAVQGLQYLQGATRRFNEDLSRGAAGTPRTPRPGITMETRYWYNPDLKSRRFMVPAIMGVLLLVTTMMITSMALVKEREDGTFEQLALTPVRPAEIVAGKLLPYALIGFVGVTLALPMIVFVFGVPLRGSIAGLYGVSALFLMTTLGTGLLVSTLVHTQQQAMLVSAFGIMMPFVLLSGFIFPVQNMPRILQPVAHLIPLTYYVDAVRGLFLKGAGIHALAHDAIALAVLGTLILTAAVLKFHKRLD